MLRDVVHPEEVRPRGTVDKGERERAREAFVGVGVSAQTDAAHETLAREGRHDGVAQRREIGGVTDEREVLVDGLAEAQARVEDDAVGRDAGLDRALGGGGEEGTHIGDDVGVGRGGGVLVRVRITARGREAVHEDDAGTMLGGQGEELGAFGACRDVVDRIRAAVERGARDGGESGVDADGHGVEPSRAADRLENRKHAGELFLGVDALSAGAGGLAAQVEHVGAEVDGAFRGVEGVGDRREPAAVGETVGREVEDGDDDGAIQEDRDAVGEIPDGRGHAGAYEAWLTNNAAMRYVAIDLGDKRTGLAIGDTITGVVTPLDVLEVPVAVRGGEALLEALAKAVEAQLGGGAASAKAGLVVGLPINMDDSEGPRAKQVRAFAGRIAAKTGFVVEFQDERLTSAEADWSMARSGMTRQEKKQRRDALAAATILRDFLRGKMSPLADGEDRVFDA